MQCEHTMAPQIENVNEDTDIVLATMGGNDIDFDTVVKGKKTCEKKKQQQEQIRDVIELFFSFVQMLVMFSSLTEHISGFYLFDITYYQSMFHIFSPCWWQELQSKEATEFALRYVEDGALEDEVLLVLDTIVQVSWIESFLCCCLMSFSFS